MRPPAGSSPPGYASAPAETGVVVYRRTVRADAIDEYSRRLTAALAAEAGVGARYVAGGLPEARRRVGRPAWVLLQYNPFAYGHWGVAPGLLARAWSYRRRAVGPLAVMVHEAWVEPGDRGRARWRSTLMGTYQRAQLEGLLGVADVVLAATEGLARRIGHGAVHVPVAANVTPVAVGRAEARGRLGLDGGALVVCLFGTGHPSRALEYATAAIDALAAAHGTGGLRVLNLGLGAPALGLAQAVAVDTPGHLDEVELSLRLRAADLLLLPFAGGISTRRTTLMAGLAHGLPVVGLRGPETDDVLTASREALTLTPVGDLDAFARATLALAGDPEQLRRGGEAARALYAREFDWPIMAGRVAAALGLGGA